MIEGTLSVEYLDPAPKFFALSYCWGAPDFTQTILIDSCQFKVTATLEKALKACRAIGCSVIWADQICINQADVGERNSQVQLMRRIYSLTYCVLAYIGDEGQYTKIGIEFVEELLRRLNRNEQEETKSVREVAIPKSLAYATHLPPPKLRSNRLQRLWKLWHTEITSRMLPYSAIQKVALGLFDLVDRPFFERQWILQEVTLTQRVFALCGDLNFSWASLLGANACLWRFGEFRPTILGRVSIKTFREKIQRVEDCRQNDISISSKCRWHGPLGRSPAMSVSSDVRSKG